MTQRVDIKKCSSKDIGEASVLEEKYILDGWSEKAFLEWFENNNDPIIFKAVSNEKTIGFINGSYVCDEGELLNIVVENTFRNRGVASALLMALEEYLMKKSVKKLFLEVREKNTPAIKFYEKNEFIKIGLRKNYYKAPDDNGVLMMKKITYRR